LLQHLGPKLSQGCLDVATSQASSGRCTLKQSLFALLHVGLKAWALLNACNGLSLCLWAK
jgi:hypothetical protein